jgi:hypothetical protein
MNRSPGSSLKRADTGVSCFRRDDSEATWTEPRRATTDERALERVRLFFRADRCALRSVSADLQMVNMRMESCGAGVARVPADTNLAQANG